MRFTREEIRLARHLRAIGLQWRPAIGDWYVSDDGFVSIVRGNGDGLHVGQTHTWLPEWRKCREWLRERGYAHPEFPTDDSGSVRIEFMGEGGHILVGSGVTDLECVYSIMSTVLEDGGG